MSSKPHYFAIGIFVLAATALGLVGIVLISSDAMSSPENFVETYVDESVQGIEVGTPFKLRGVKVGSVCKIAMVSAVYETDKMYVMIRVALDRDAMDFEEKSLETRVREQVKRGLRFKLVPQGITGLSFLEADLFPDTDSDPLVIDWDPDFIYVPSTPATMTLISRSLEKLSAQLDTLDLTAIGNNIEAITSNLNVSVEHVEELTGNAARASDEVIGNIRIASADLPTITSNLTETTEQLEALITSSDRDVDQVLSNLRYITDDARELIRMLKRHPGMLLSEPPDANLSTGGRK
ncbi:Paraquat-inducible protein B [Pontiella desulfatans]|uniref:Paraquat-inducible protein B n=1 Tax=Pontiella desulfatans TaxID=2750659 RepID=A0A6C2U1A7_PONDE|nr:MlaD family protein [Pontiella desulfatans]VGO13758.1 Paraquat-inducible protein B [Pontiella desulfatans]